MEKIAPYLIAISALIMVATTCLHVFIGTADVMQPILTAQLDPVAVNTSYVVWHMVSLTLALSAAALIWLVFRANLPLLIFLFALHAGFAIVFIVINITAFGGIWTMPQWTIFALVASLFIPGLKRRA